MVLLALLLLMFPPLFDCCYDYIDDTVVDEEEFTMFEAVELPLLILLFIDP